MEKLSSDWTQCVNYKAKCSAYIVINIIVIHENNITGVSSRGFSTGLWPPFSHNFWRGMKEYAKFITILNSIDTLDVCWLFGWGYFCGQSANKTRKKVGRFRWVFQVMAHNRLWSFLALRVCSTWYVGMFRNDGYSHASMISGFILFLVVLW